MEFIENHADVGDDVKVNDDDDDAGQVRTLLDKEFIHNEESFWDQGPSDYRLVNVTKDRTKACADFDDWNEYQCSDPENYVHDSCKDFVPEYDEFKGYEKRIENLTRV